MVEAVVTENRRVMIKANKLFSLASILFFALAAQNAIAQELETIATFDATTPPGNIAIGPDGRIFLSVHGFYGQAVKVVELLKDGSTKPYPNNEWAYEPTESNGLYDVLGLNVDERGVLWLLDTSGSDRSGRLIGWDTKQEELHKIIYLAPPIIKLSSFLNDIAVDSMHDYIYIADTAGDNKAAIIIVNLTTGQARRVLEGSKFTIAEDINMMIDGQTIKLNEKPARLGINPITIDPNYEWVYFGAMSGTAIYRIKTADLRNELITPAELEDRIERYGDKPISDGITMDGGGNVYITSITDDSIGVVGKSGKYKTLFKQDSISWPDGFAYGPDHYIYFTVNELHRSPVLNGGVNGSQNEMKVMRFKALVEGKQGR